MTSPTYDEMRDALREWIIARNSLSSDCQRLGISSSVADTPKWAEELAKRCEALRDFCEKYKLWELKDDRRDQESDRLN